VKNQTDDKKISAAEIGAELAEIRARLSVLLAEVRRVRLGSAVGFPLSAAVRYAGRALVALRKGVAL